METTTQPESYKLGIDLGGTNIRAGLVANGKIIKSNQAKLPKSTNNADEILQVIFNTIDEVFCDEVTSIGIGAPGLIDIDNMAIHSLVNIPALSYVPIGKILKEKYQRPVKIDNDANCHTIGIHKYGIGKGFDNMVGLALGTGLGAGIINDGKLIKDVHRGSGEFGEIPYLDSKIEAYCSGQFFQNTFKKDGEQLMKEAKNSNAEAIEGFKAFGKHLGKAIKIIMLTVNPKLIVIGGSVAHSKKYFHDAMIEEINDFVYPIMAKQIKIEYSDIPNIALIGAASL